MAHGNTLRALIKHLDRITDEEIVHLEVPTARPLVYRLDSCMTPIIPGSVYLDDATVETPSLRIRPNRCDTRR